MNEYKEFKKYAKGHVGISGLDLHNYEKQVESGLYTGHSNSISPMILEEREMRATMMSVFDRLMMDRLLWVAGPVNDNMSAVTQAQLMFLDNTGSEDITMHIDSPGGSVKAGLSMVDVMDYVKSDIKTVNMGMAASMGSVLLGAGTKGKRSSLRHSKTMLHQSSGGFSGNIQDAEIDMKEWKKVNDILFKLLGEYCGKTAKEVGGDATRDFWLTAEEAKKYGIIDSVIKRRK
jgi:ATP-dependent Clp protease protease subunit|tara:strand:- start:2392 stop:3087 length:696 start_codon:yes stop_codon:yes gene_type:complete